MCNCSTFTRQIPARGLMRETKNLLSRKTSRFGNRLLGRPVAANNTEAASPSSHIVGGAEILLAKRNCLGVRAMFNRRQTIVSLGIALGVWPIAGWPALTHADSPFIAMFKKRTAAEANAYELRPEHGPWLILASTLSGEDAQQKAQALCKELKQQLKTDCYILDKTFDHSKMLTTQRYETRKLDGSPEARRVRLANQSSEHVYAVLVGNYSSLEDPSIAGTLETIRTAKPASLAVNAADAKDLTKGDSSNWMVSNLRQHVWARTDRKENLVKGPMGAAFVTRNPLLPDDFFQAAKVDDFVVKLNKNVEYSLLKCPKRFTVRVASFQGNAATTISATAAEAKTNSVSDKLDYAAERANRLTTALRAKDVEAYEYHDRYASYVTIGGFDELGNPLPSGEFQYNSQILSVLEEWCGYRMVEAQDPVTRARTKIQSLNSLEKIPFDIEGKPMAVPRAETSRLYDGSKLGRKLFQ